MYMMRFLPTDWKGKAKRECNRVKKISFEAVGHEWVSKDARLHFNRGAYVRYGYKKRSRAWDARKAKKQGVPIPCVWTGRTKSNALAGRVRATSKGVRITFQAPGTVTRDVTVVVPSEVKHLEKLATRVMKQRLKLP